MSRPKDQKPLSTNLEIRLNILLEDARCRGHGKYPAWAERKGHAAFRLHAFLRMAVETCMQFPIVSGALFLNSRGADGLL